jgi:c-di-GMP phosphodiesterase
VNVVSLRLRMNLKLIKNSQTGTPSDFRVAEKLTRDHYLQLLEKLTELSGEAFIAFDEEDRYIYWSDGMERLTGFPKEKVLGKKGSDLFPNLESTHIFECHAAAIKGTKKSVVNEFAIPETNRSGHFEATYYPAIDPDGRPYGIGIIRDITSKKLYEDHLKQMTKEREDFISIASHELKTPLASLKLRFQIADRFKSDTEQLNDLMEFANKQINQMESLISNLLDLTRIRAGKLILDLEKVSLCEIVEEVVAAVSPLKGFEKAQDIKFECESDVIGNWDRTRIAQIVTNLLTNAKKFGNGNGIRIGVGQEGDEAVISVQDYGKGIPKEDLESLFQRFNQGKNNDSRGLGLGLFITREIVLAHRGTIAVDSKLGEGSTFTVRLPLKPEI